MILLGDAPPDPSIGLEMEDVRIAHLQGRLGSTAQIGRAKALEDAVNGGNGWTIVHQQGERSNMTRYWTIFDSMLAVAGGKDFNVIWGETDDLVYYALDRLTDAGLRSDDYIIVSFDGDCTAVELVKAGIVDVIAECTPLFADQIGALPKRVDAGETVDKLQWAVEGVIDATNVDEKLPLCFGS